MATALWNSRQWTTGNLANGFVSNAASSSLVKDANMANLDMQNVSQYPAVVSVEWHGARMVAGFEPDPVPVFDDLASTMFAVL